MKKYKVLQPFISFDNLYLSQGSMYCIDEEDLTTFEMDFVEHLDNCMFIEEIPEQPKTVWDLKKGDSCWIIYCRADGEVRIQCIQFSQQYDAERSLGLLFLTREEAEKELARYKAKVILQRDTKGFKPNWEGKADRCYGWNVIYNPTTYKLFANIDYNHLNDGTLRFATQEDAEASIKAHEKEWKTYLGVEK